MLLRLNTKRNRKSKKILKNKLKFNFKINRYNNEKRTLNKITSLNQQRNKIQKNEINNFLEDKHNI